MSPPDRPETLWRGASPLTVTVLAALMLLPTAIAHETEWEDADRRLEIDARPDRFELRSDRVQGEDRIRLELDRDAVRFRLQGARAT